MVGFYSQPISLGFSFEFDSSGKVRFEWKIVVDYYRQPALVFHSNLIRVEKGDSSGTVWFWIGPDYGLVLGRITYQPDYAIVEGPGLRINPDYVSHRITYHLRIVRNSGLQGLRIILEVVKFLIKPAYSRRSGAKQQLTST